ncbi:DUF1996 domain-containing protein [Streptomyces stackebrandtii]|uniref:DUF1996 domain-containing protein n=1 Tax=Streptomyces stackebrandtii TaxID=3051177 RepID=UPI0028DBAF7E|nr:DUF1996 domain-containing protein [Streptomyces sp. DSM 40976]
MGSVRGWVIVLVCLSVGGVLTVALLGVSDGGGPYGTAHATAGPGDFVDIRDVPPSPDIPPSAGAPLPGSDASTGTVMVDCGRNVEEHYNQDNMVVSPGLRGGAHHTHAYVGNLSTDARSTDASLAAASTTCRGGDRSTYFWPVLRRTDRPARYAFEKAAGHGNTGEILRPVEVRLEFAGSPVGEVVAMPRFLRAVTGDAVALTARSEENVRARWGCASVPDRFTTRYPRCPAGDRLTRTLTFPSCWNGLDTAGPERTHLAFRAVNGVCPRDMFAVPELTIRLAYDAPGPDVPIALDSFPEQRHSPKTDHAMFVNVMTDARMAALVDCVNEGRHCRL